MSAESQATEGDLPSRPRVDDHLPAADGPGSHEEEEEEGDEDDEDEDEPKLKYARLTGSLTGVYRNGDSTSAFLAAGDRMVLGTHDGRVHVLGLPALQSLSRPFQVHQATVTSVSISPTPPPYRATGGSAAERSDARAAHTLSPLPVSRGPTGSASAARASQSSAAVAAARNQIYIGTSSMDGHVCIFPLANPNDAHRRNFARPVNALALSPEYRSDKTYLSGGLAGQLILTEGGRSGTTIDANTNSAAAASSGWLGSIGLGGDRGKDTALHAGEGAISAIRWSPSGKWVVWVNEEGIKIMRSHLKLGSENSEDAWRRIAHAARPRTEVWNNMAGVWKGKCEWYDHRRLEADLNPDEKSHTHTNGANGTSATAVASSGRKGAVERLVVGWGDLAWVMQVQEGGTDQAKQNLVGSADILHKLVFTDSIVSGITAYTPSLVAVLAWRTRDDDDRPIEHQNTTKAGTPRKGRSHRHTSLKPQLRLVEMATGSEIDVDELSMSRFESLAAQDYHLGALWIPALPSSKAGNSADQKGALEGLFDAAGGKYAARMLSSGASIMSGSSEGRADNNGHPNNMASPHSSATAGASTSATQQTTQNADSHPYASCAGLKLFIHSPYDCILAVKRDPTDRLTWLLEQQHYAEAWKLIDDNPDVVDVSAVDQRSVNSPPGTPSHARGSGGSLADFFADRASVQGSTGGRAPLSAVDREKLRVGDLWLRQLTSADRWSEAGLMATKILTTGQAWEHWASIFAKADKHDEIVHQIPPFYASSMYESYLRHYVAADPPCLRELVTEWDLELFDVSTVVQAIEERLRQGDASEQSVEDGVVGRDWTALVETLALLYRAEGRSREALSCFIRVRNADEAFELIRNQSLLEASDVPGMLMLRVSPEMMRTAPLSELEEASSEALQILVEEAQRGTIPISSVINQLTRKGDAYRPFLFFYFRTLWRGKQGDDAKPRPKYDRSAEEGKMLVDRHADLAVELFADYDRIMLSTFLRESSAYSFDRAIALCEDRDYHAELVHVLAKTGQTKRALALIINKIGDVIQAMEFAKEHPDLWDDLVDYSIDKPTFILGLLEEAGAAVDPIKLIRRIPEGLQIEGLRQGVTKLLRDSEIQYSIADGAARVLASELTTSLDTLRAGRKRGVRFDIVHDREGTIDPSVSGQSTKEGDTLIASKAKSEDKHDPRATPPGHCAGCGEAFHEQESEPLLGFACGHISHLSCLLRAGGSSDAEIRRLLRQLGYLTFAPAGDDRLAPDDRDGLEADADASDFAGRSVGAKVAHAHVIRNVVRGGCPVCGIAADEVA